MTGVLLRRLRRLADDPVLRRWLIARLTGRTKQPAGWRAHRPPYLSSEMLDGSAGDAGGAAFAELQAGPPRAPIDVPLPGRTVTLEPGAEAALFDAAYDDTETVLAVHRFAWLPLAGPDVDASWVDALWRAWSDRHGGVDRSWAWHPYTAAERAINILDFTRRRGLPGERGHTLEILAAHGPAILDRLEYFGDHDTSNHLSNNGRGLFMLGLALGVDRWADIGARILLAEAGRIFAPSGLLREGSSHYHLLLTRNYLAAWLAARAHGRAETGDLEMVARRAMEAIPPLTLPGGMPMIGDISPDCPPDFLSALLPGGDADTGWVGQLPDEERAAFERLKADCGRASPHRLAEDGWHRFEQGAWAALWHVAPEGWAPMPGHGHQDTGSVELHHGPDRVIVDPGRGAYGEDGEAARYVSAGVHSALTVDGHDPYPPNRPYYDAAFRRAVGGPPPRVTRDRNGVTLGHDGFARLGGVGTAERRFAFDSDSMRITDSIAGESRRAVTRRLHTTCAVRRDGDGVVLEAGNKAFRLSAEGEIALVPATCWTAYGAGSPSTIIEISATCALPFASTLVLRKT